MIRKIKNTELQELLNLYLFLHEDKVPEMDSHLYSIWDEILSDSNHHIIVAEKDGHLVSSCVCVIIPNLTRNIRPYAIVENVVTHKEYRNKGFAKACLNHAREISKEAGCYKMMLLTGTKNLNIINFYKQAGYNSEDKTAFVQWL